MGLKRSRLYAAHRVATARRPQCCTAMPRKAATQARSRLAAGVEASYGVDDSEDEQDFASSDSGAGEHGAHEVQLIETRSSY